MTDRLDRIQKPSRWSAAHPSLLPPTGEGSSTALAAAAPGAAGSAASPDLATGPESRPRSTHHVVKTCATLELWVRTFRRWRSCGRPLRNFVSRANNAGPPSAMATSRRSRLGSNSLRKELLHEWTQFSAQQTWCASPHTCELPTYALNSNR